MALPPGVTLKDPAEDLPPGVTPIQKPAPPPAEKGLLRRGWEGLGEAGSTAGRALYSLANPAKPYAADLSGGRYAAERGRAGTDPAIPTREQYGEVGKFAATEGPLLAATGALTGGGGALGKLSAEALGVLPRALPAAGRILGSAAAGGGQAGLEGQSVGKGALLSGAAAGTMEGANVLAPKAVDLGRRVVGRALGHGTEDAAAKAAAKATEQTAADLAKETLRSQTGHRVGTEAGQVIPGLGVASGKDLHKLAVGGEGRQILNQQFKQTLEGIDQGLRTNRITGIHVPELGDGPMTVREAVDALQLVGKGMGKAVAAERSVGQRNAALDYGKAREALVTRLNQVSPGAGDQLSAALTQSSRGRAYLKIIGQSMDPNGQLDPAKLAKNVNKYAGQLQDRFGSAWPQMQKTLTGGQALPMTVPQVPKGPAWQPQAVPSTPTPSMSGAGILAADVLAAQPGNREAVIGGAMSLLPSVMSHLPGHNYLPLEIMELGG